MHKVNEYPVTNIISVYDSTYDPLARPDPTLTLANERAIAVRETGVPLILQASVRYNCLYSLDLVYTP